MDNRPFFPSKPGKTDAELVASAPQLVGANAGHSTTYCGIRQDEKILNPYFFRLPENRLPPVLGLQQFARQTPKTPVKEALPKRKPESKRAEKWGHFLKLRALAAHQEKQNASRKAAKAQKEKICVPSFAPLRLCVRLKTVQVSYHLLEITGLFHWLLQGPTARWHTSLGQRPRSHGNATPGLKARSITVGEKMLRAFSADAFSASFPGALPQAGMLPRLWRSRVCVFLRDGLTPPAASQTGSTCGCRARLRRRHPLSARPPSRGSRAPAPR